MYKSIREREKIVKEENGREEKKYVIKNNTIYKHVCMLKYSSVAKAAGEKKITLCYRILIYCEIMCPIFIMYCTSAMLNQV
jgi:hypothetical protein